MKLLAATIGVLSCSAAMLVSSTGRTDQISNPNFFQPGAGAETHEAAGVFLTGSSGWQAIGTAANPDGGLTYSQFGAGYNGAQYYGELNNNAPTGPGGWQQVINTIAGDLYSLSFAYNYLSPGDHTPTSFTAAAFDGSVAYSAVPGSSLASQSYTVPDRGFGIQQPWFTTSFDFVASSNETTIRFTSDEWHTNAFGPAIDGVSVIALPEPSSVVALFGLGAMGLLLLARRRGVRDEETVGQGNAR